MGMGSRFSSLPGGAAIPAALGVLVLVVVALVVLDLARAERVAEGVSVDGVEIGDRSAEEASAVVREEVAPPLERSVVAARGDRELELGPQRSRVEVDVDATIDAAVARSREGVPGIRVVRDLVGDREVEVDLDPEVRYSAGAVESFVERVAEELDREPRDADVEPSAEGLETTAERHGFEVDRGELRNRIASVLSARDERTVRVPGERSPPNTTLDDLAERHPHFIVIDREGFRLRHYEGLELEATYPISVGDIGHNTPSGNYDISNKAVNPTWYVPDSDWAGELAGESIPPGPDNPIKSRWLGIEDGIGIHGTDEVGSIGERASRGCIRMLIGDVEELYDQVPVGASVYIG
jgi:lipoprotein-anchoring transpeptidase ErfK/SrfK